MFNPGWPHWVGFKALGFSDAVRTLALFSFLGSLFAVLDLHSDHVSGASNWAAIAVMPALTYVVGGVWWARSIWDATEKRDLPGSEERPRYHGLFVLLSAYLVGLTWVGVHAQTGNAGWPWAVDLEQGWQLALFLGIAALGFIPLLYGYHLVASEAQRDSDRGAPMYLLHPDGPTNWSTMGIGAFLLGALTLGAWAAGENKFEMSGNFGLIIMGAVLGGFLLFVFLPHVRAWLSGLGPDTQTYEDTAVAQGFTAHPGHLFSSMDAAFVRLFAPLSGATLQGRMVPQLMLMLILTPLAVMGFYLPAPYGLAPLAVGGVIIFALGRRWTWVEGDRETALRIQTTVSDRFRIGFSNDLRDEALLGYAALFLLVPLALRQVQIHYEVFEGSGTGMLEWLRFFGTELAKGVPIVDWIDIYDVSDEPVFTAKDAPGKHIVFVARLIVDVVIIAALLQAIGIVQRNRAQKQLFQNGQIDFFDPFVERSLLRAAYKTPSASKAAPIRQKWLDFFQAHKKESNALRRGDYYYNPRRLNELINSEDSRIKAVAEWMARDLIIGSVRERLAKILEKERNRAAMDDIAQSEWDRELYRALDDTLEDAKASRKDAWHYEDSRALSQLLSEISERREFDHLRYKAFNVLERSGTLHAALALSARLIPANDVPQATGLSKDTALEWCFKRQSRQIERSAVAESLTAIYLTVIDSGSTGPGSDLKRFCTSVAEYVRKDVGQLAKEAVDAIK